MSLWTAIYNRLTGSNTLTQLLGEGTGSIYFGRLPSHKKFPWVYYAPASSGVPLFQAPAQPGAIYLETLLVQVDAYAEDDQVVRNIAVQLGVLLDIPWNDTSGLLAMYRQSSTDEIMMEEQSNENANDVWHVPLLYEAWVQKTL